jgi:hypothetical protein
MEEGNSGYRNESGRAAMVSPAAKGGDGMNTPIAAFQDNFEHLQALEKEAKYLLAAAALRRSAEHGMDNGRRVAAEGAGALGGDSGEDVSKSFPFLGPEASLHEVQLALDRVINENRVRENLTFRKGLTLNFNTFVSEWGLDEFERLVLLLLLMRHTAPEFNSMYEKYGFEERSRDADSNMRIGALLSVICPQLRDQLAGRRYFSIDGTLMREGVVRFRGYYRESRNINILHEYVHLDERVVQHILGDTNLYSPAFRFIKIEKSSVRLDQVVLAEGLKEEIVSLTGDYLARRGDGTMEDLDEFYGYGTGLVLMFYGASGTGKTMLSRALAANFNSPLITFSLEDLQRVNESPEDILAMLFKEAALRRGIVFLDECDDLFEESSSLNHPLLLEIERARCVVIMATNKPVALDPALERRVAMKAHFKMPDSAMRLKLWKALLPEGVRLADDVDLGDFAERYQFSGGLIKNCLFLASMKAIRTWAGPAPGLDPVDPGDKNGVAPLLTRELLEYAANLQKSALAEELSLGSPYAPSRTIERLPLPARQREKLKRIAPVWTKVKSEKEGLNVFMRTSNMKVGLMTAEALARACGMKVREFPLKKLLGAGATEEDKVIDPISQKKMSPLEYAFAETVGEACMTLFRDDEGEFDAAIKSDKDSDMLQDLFLSSFIAKLRGHNGFTCTVSPAVHLKKLPFEFHLDFVLEYPPEETQIREWENHLGKGTVSDDDLVGLVERHPMHVAEIGEIAHRAWIRAYMGKGKGEIELADVNETIVQYRFSSDAPLLFGEKS